MHFLKFSSEIRAIEIEMLHDPVLYKSIIDTSLHPCPDVYPVSSTVRQVHYTHAPAEASHDRMRSY